MRARLIVPAILLLTALLLAGCGGNDTSQTDTSSADTTGLLENAAVHWVGDSTRHVMVRGNTTAISMNRLLAGTYASAEATMEDLRPATHPSVRMLSLRGDVLWQTPLDEMMILDVLPLVGDVELVLAMSARVPVQNPTPVVLALDSNTGERLEQTPVPWKKGLIREMVTVEEGVYPRELHWVGQDSLLVLGREIDGDFGEVYGDVYGVVIGADGSVAYEWQPTAHTLFPLTDGFLGAVHTDGRNGASTTREVQRIGYYGDVQWDLQPSMEFGAKAVDAVEFEPHGDILVLGVQPAHPDGPHQTRSVLMKINEKGHLRWVRSPDPLEGFHPTGAVPWGRGKVLVAGWVSSRGATENPAVFLVNEHGDVYDLDIRRDLDLYPGGVYLVGEREAVLVGAGRPDGRLKGGRIHIGLLRIGADAGQAPPDIDKARAVETH